LIIRNIAAAHKDYCSCAMWWGGEEWEI